MNAGIFPGQGSQRVGMGLGLAQAYPWALQLAEKTDRLLGRPLSRLCFQGPENALKQTINTQPAIFFASVLAWEALQREGVKVTAVAGHSLGEYSALYAAGVASYEDLLRLVEARAQAMESACPTGSGAMAAVMMLAPEKAEEACREVADLGVCVVANYNGPGQLVISGAVQAVEAAGRKAIGKGARRVIPLDVSGAFHSPLMKPARDRLADAIAAIPFRDAGIPVYGNIDALPTKNAGELKRKLLDQLTGSVRWEETVRRLSTDGFRRFVELGAGKVLAGLVKKIQPEIPVFPLHDPETLQETLRGLGHGEAAVQS